MSEDSVDLDSEDIEFQEYVENPAEFLIEYKEDQDACN